MTSHGRGRADWVTVETPVKLRALIEQSADPPSVRALLSRLDGETAERLASSTSLAEAFVAVAAASRSLSRLLEIDSQAWAVLDDLETQPALGGGEDDHGSDAGDEPSTEEALLRWKRLEYLRIAARDLLDLDSLETTTGLLSDLAVAVLNAAVEIVGAEDLAVVGMGKLGGWELNYASDIDICFVGGGVREARAVMDVVRPCFRVDANLRPEGRNGPLTRSLDSYVAYWQRWASPWEFQALLKAVPVAGSVDLGESWMAAASEVLWGRPLDRDDLRSLRDMKARTEGEVIRKGIAEWELKRGPGGIRDVEFSVQLLQLVHGKADANLRSRSTLQALGQLAAGGYVDEHDASQLADAYRFLRNAEHAVQLEDEQQTHVLPSARDQRRRVARVLGYTGTLEAGPTESFDRDLARQRNLVRSIHERLYFRPLLDALAGVGPMPPAAADHALVTFGFAEVDRTRQAVTELTRGLTRSSRMMRQLLPLLLDWLSGSPDPDRGLLGLRKLATGEQRTRELVGAFRDNPEVARQLCVLMGTSGLLGDVLVSNPDLVGRLADPERLQTQPLESLTESARNALAWRTETSDRQHALRRWRLRHLLGVAARDVSGHATVGQVGQDLTAIAEACLQLTLETLRPSVPFAVIALGRLAGRELAYASDLDLVFVHGGSDFADHQDALRTASALMRFLGGTTPAARIYAIDPNLRPEGKDGPLARSLGGYATYFDRWALTWERQAMSRARPVAGDQTVAEQFMDMLQRAVWERPFTDDDEREVRRMKARIERERIPWGEDPDFHLKLGRGSLSDVEWTGQLLQLRHGVRSPGTLDGLTALQEAEVLAVSDAQVLSAAYRFCERTRDRWWLVGSAPTSTDALPADPDESAKLARSLGTNPSGLRDEYRRVTRRARQVMERLFYNA